MTSSISYYEGCTVTYSLERTLSQRAFWVGALHTRFALKAPIELPLGVLSDLKAGRTLAESPAYRAWVGSTGRQKT
jgi:hypothetical protein